MSVIDEINRGKEYAKSLDKRHSCPEIKVEPTYKQDKHLYRDVFVERCIVPDYTPNYDECRHIKRNIVNRDELDIKEHINLLAQPKFVPKKTVEQPYIVKRKVPGPTPRILELARPNKRKTLETSKRYASTMPKFCIENCHRNIQDVTFVPVHEAVYFIKSKTSKTVLEKRRLKLRMNQLQEKIKKAKMAMMKEIIQKVYSLLKVPLLTPVDNITDAPTVKLSSVIKNKLCKMLDHTTELVEDVFLDQFIVHISDKLAIWMNDLLSPNQTALTKIVVEPITQDAVTNSTGLTATGTSTTTSGTSTAATGTTTATGTSTTATGTSTTATVAATPPTTGTNISFQTQTVSATNTKMSTTVVTT